MAITIETAGRAATRTPASSPSRVRHAIEEYAVSAARRSTTLCSSRACGSARSTSVVIAAVTSSPRWAATRVATRSADSGIPAIASPAITRAARSGVAWGRSACTPRLARRPRTRASVGPRPQSSSERSTTGPSTSRSKPIGLSNRSSSGPSATMGSGSVRSSGSAATLSVASSARTRPRWPAWSGQTACRPSSVTTRCTGTDASNRSTVSQPPSTARDRIMVSAGHSGRGVSESAELPSSSQTASALVRTPFGTRSARSSPRSRTVTATRSYFPGSTSPSGPMTTWDFGASWTKPSSAGPGPIRLCSSREASPAARAAGSAAAAPAASTAW